MCRRRSFRQHHVEDEKVELMRLDFDQAGDTIVPRPWARPSLEEAAFDHGGRGRIMLDNQHAHLGPEHTPYKLL
jgi:hypothetical protein